MSVQENKAIVRRIYDDLWNERKLKVADEVIAAEGYINYDTGLSPVPANPKDMKQTFRMVTAGFPNNRHNVGTLRQLLGHAPPLGPKTGTTRSGKDGDRSALDE
jgi:hypothetical protein